ncbi:MAG: hypothetical protein LBI60_06725 [Bacteroidales bacterium]|jgi:hypothetical protein|nr:hypothetical protein [Bacteroidales bacterium]
MKAKMKHSKETKLATIQLMDKFNIRQHAEYACDRISSSDDDMLEYVMEFVFDQIGGDEGLSEEVIDCLYDKVDEIVKASLHGD